MSTVDSADRPARRFDPFGNAFPLIFIGVLIAFVGCFWIAQYLTERYGGSPWPQEPGSIAEKFEASTWEHAGSNALDGSIRVARVYLQGDSSSDNVLIGYVDGVDSHFIRLRTFEPEVDRLIPWSSVRYVETTEGEKAPADKST